MNTSPDGQPRERRRGRPSIVAGEPSVEVSVSLEQPLYERLQRLAGLRREDHTEFIGKKLPDTGHYS